MTVEEAIKWIQAIKDKYIHGGDEGYDNQRKEALDIAITVLQKQIPMKPVKIDVKRHNGYGYYIGHSLICPACEKRLGVAKVKHCGCGQALLWDGTK